MDGRRFDGCTISSPCEPNGSAELKIVLNTLDFTSVDCMQSPNTIESRIVIIFKQSTSVTVVIDSRITSFLDR